MAVLYHFLPRATDAFDIVHAKVKMKYRRLVAVPPENRLELPPG